MRDIDTFNRTSILENAKNWHKNQFQHNCHSLVFLRISQKLTKIAQYSYKVLKVLFIFHNLETLHMPNNKHPRKNVNVAKLLFKRILNV